MNATPAAIAYLHENPYDAAEQKLLDRLGTAFAQMSGAATIQVKHYRLAREIIDEHLREEAYVNLVRDLTSR